jgi:hypothetical protein
VARLKYVIVKKKNGLNKSVRITTKKTEVTSISVNQLNHNALEKSHAIKELFGYTVYINVHPDVSAKQ